MTNVMTKALLVFLLACAAPVFCADDSAGTKRTGGDVPAAQRGGEESLFLNLKKVDVGAVTSAEEKKQYLMTIQLEKQRVQHHMLTGIYDNAYRLYKEGDYEQAQELARRILSIDPNYQDARLLMQASGQLGGSSKGYLSEAALIDEKFSQGLALYKEGRLVEAARMWEDVLKLAPGNLKASYWLKKANREIAAEHVRLGNVAYSEHRLDEALNQWYNALLLKKDDQEIIGKIAEVENELRADRANKQLQLALDYYGQGKVVKAYNALKGVLEIQPGDAKAQKLAEEVRGEIGGGYITSGKKAYSARRYNQAIEQWDKAKEWGYDKKYVNLLIARAKEQMKRDEEAKLRKAEDAQRAAAEEAEAERKAAEAERNAKVQNEMGGGSDGNSLPGAGTEVSAENKKAARQHYLRGLIFFQQNDYEKAREEWTVAKQLDPSYSEPDAGLKRIEEMYSQ